jgi:hypothetical protein
MSVQLSGAASVTIPCTSGTWSTSLDLSSATDGTLALTATLLPAPSGGVAPTVSVQLIKDTQAPNAPTLSTVPSYVYTHGLAVSWTDSDVGLAQLAPTSAYTISLFAGGGTCAGAPNTTFTSSVANTTLPGLVEGVT